MPRPIDVHEDAIVSVLDSVEHDGLSFEQAVRHVAEGYAPRLTTTRLAQLTRTWCAVAGIEVPA